MEEVQLMKDYTTEGTKGAIEFYLYTNSTWRYEELIEHLRTSFESGKTFNSLVTFSDLRKWNQFADELQILGQKVISVRPSWKSEVNEAL